MSDATTVEQIAMTGRERVIIGVLGGVAATVVKFLGQDYARVFPDSGINFARAEDAIFGYMILIILLGFLGALCAWASDESRKFKLLAIAVAAPAMITTFTGGGDYTNVGTVASRTAPAPTAGTSLIPFISSAHAADQVSRQQNAFSGQRTAGQKFDDALRFVFRVGESRYWVVAGSFKDKAKADEYVNKINAVDAGLGAFIGIKGPNGFYPIIVGRYGTLPTARATLTRAKKIDFVKSRGPFLSPG